MEADNGNRSESSRKPFLHYLAWAAAHAALFMLLYTGLRVIQGQPPLRSDAELLAFDADLYRKIVATGYDYESDKGIIAFFPGFPWLWKFTRLSTQGIALLNMALFATALAWLGYLFRFSTRELLLSASLPSMVFMFVPFSEALFFLEFTILLYGLKNNNMSVAVLGIFLCSVTRSSANVFIPALLLMTLLSDREGKWLKGAVYTLSAVAGVLLVAWVQFVHSGQVFGFIQAQKLWGHRLQWPRLPFDTWGSVLWLDGLALTCGMMAISAVIYWLYRLLKKQTYPPLPETLVFSAGYVAGLTFLSIVMKGGHLFSLNRYLIPGAAFVLCLVYLIRHPWSRKQLISIGTAIFLFFCLVHAFRHIRVLLQCLGAAMYIFLFFSLSNRRYARLIFYLLYAAGLLLQAYLADKLAHIDWVA